MARYTIGRILPIFQGDWDSTQTYDKLDIVLKDTISYVSLIDDNNTTPTENSANWQVVCRGATAEEVVESIEGGQLQLGRLDVDDDIQAGAIYVNNVPVATTNDIRYGIDEVSIDQTGTDRVNIETTMIGGGGSSSSILSATSTRAGVMTATDKAKLDSIFPQGDHPVEVEADGNGDLDVSDDAGYVIGRFENGHIRTKNFYSGNIYTKSEVDNLIGSGGVTQQQLNTALATKQNTLVSGTNIKTVNGTSLLGSGDITINKDGNQWEGKKWFAYGTSMTNTSNEGKYATYLTTLSGMIRNNRGFSGGGITTASNQTIYNAIMDDTDGKASADLITLEVGANDGSAPLGSLTDYSNNSTFIGALILCIRHLQAVTNAQIVVFPSPTSRYNRSNPSTKYDGTETFGSDSHTILDRNEAIRKVCMMYDVPFIAPCSNLGYARCNASNNYNVDQIHHTDLGGYNYALSIWSQLKNIPNFKTTIDI